VNHANSFIYFDGDDVGARIELLLLRNDPDAAAAVSRDVVRAVGEIADAIRIQLGGTVLFAAGDEVLACVNDAPDPAWLDLVRDRFRFATHLTISCGVGGTAAEAASNLHMAKLLGKNRAVGLVDR